MARVQVTGRLKLVPWAIVRGRMAAKVKPGGTTAVDTVRDAVPVLLITAVRTVGVPCMAAPKSIGLGVTLMPGATPTPEKGTTTTGRSGSSPTMVTAPVLVPTLVGANRTVKVAFWNGCSVPLHAGAQVIEKAPPDSEVAKVSDAVPVLRTTMVCVDDEPTRTLPKSRLAGVTTMVDLVA